MVRAFFTDMRELLSGPGALLFLVAFAAVWLGLPRLIGELAERIHAERRRAAGEPEPEGGFQIVLTPLTGLLALAAFGGWTVWLIRFVYLHRRAVFEWVALFEPFG